MNRRISTQCCIVISMCFLVVSCARNARPHRATSSSHPATLSVIPDKLQHLQDETRYLDWEPLSMFSKSLGHYRQIRSHPLSNVIISETGHQEGTGDVVEVIRIGSPSQTSVEFAIFDPNTGNRLQQYPETVDFKIDGIFDGSRSPAPGVCVACHHHIRPLNALLISNPALEASIEQTRNSGIGIRQSTVIPIPSDTSSSEKIEQFNTQMSQRFPDQFFDLKTQLKKDPGTNQ